MKVDIVYANNIRTNLYSIGYAFLLSIRSGKHQGKAQCKKILQHVEQIRDPKVNVLPVPKKL
jgi:hypothetical protein